MALFDLDGVKPVTPDSGNYWVAENATVLGRVILKEETTIRSRSARTPTSRMAASYTPITACR